MCLLHPLKITKDSRAAPVTSLCFLQTLSWRGVILQLQMTSPHNVNIIEILKEIERPVPPEILLQMLGFMVRSYCRISGGLDTYIPAQVW